MIRQERIMGVGEWDDVLLCVVERRLYVCMNYMGLYGLIWIWNGYLEASWAFTTLFHLALRLSVCLVRERKCGQDQVMKCGGIRSFDMCGGVLRAKM
jgi:hypothetical protein